ncbi:hypothetical protein HDK90DRAFT_15059 [Phyllosticta capitalensis]|uniref:DUF7580 domain-containing protein n=1 Tax=Phyllosticta capitalensis TaxID=121624 RepID=A0ABR1Z2F4_9PEZI
MSGIEVAGLVLGAVPLMIEAMKQYADGARTVKRFIKYEVPLRDLCLDLRNEKAKYENTCLQLLAGIVPHNEVAKVLDGPFWKRPDLEPAIRSRLGTSHEQFVETMIRLSEVIREIADQLKLDQTFHVQVDKSKKFKEEYKRLKFTLKKSEYDELMSSVRQHNDTLNTLLDQRSRLEQGYRSGGIRSKLPDFRKIQGYASAVHSLIQRCFVCACSNFHTTSIRLDRPRGCQEKDNQGDFRIGLLFSYSAGFSTPGPTPWNTEAVEIGLLGQEESQKTDTLSASAAVKGKRRIRFDVPVPKPPQGQLPQMAPTQQISNLCNVLNEFKQTHQNACVGYMIEGACKYGLFLPRLPTTQQDPPHSFISLRDILKRDTTVSGFSLRAKVQLAAAVANSMMELYNTPWLDLYWRKDDIFFPRNGNEAKFDSPYIGKRRLDDVHQDNELSTFSPRDESLYNLGVLLTEICLVRPFNEVLSETRGDGDGIGSSNVERRHRYKPLDEIIRKVSEEAGEEYGDAVWRCLYCDFNHRQVGFDHDDFYKVFYLEVVSHLQKTVQFLVGKIEH